MTTTNPREFLERLKETPLEKRKRLAIEAFMNPITDAWMKGLRKEYHCEYLEDDDSQGAE